MSLILRRYITRRKQSVQNSREETDRQTRVQDGNRNEIISSASSINRNHTHTEGCISSPTSETTYSETDRSVDKPKSLDERRDRSDYSEIELSLDDCNCTVKNVNTRYYDHLHQIPRSQSDRPVNRVYSHAVLPTQSNDTYDHIGSHNSPSAWHITQNLPSDGYNHISLDKSNIVWFIANQILWIPFYLLEI